MQNKKAALFVAADPNNEADERTAVAANQILERMRPIPPEDLWDQLDRMVAEIPSPKEDILPPGMFTTAQYASKKNLSGVTARRRLVKLLKAGRVKRVLLKDGRSYGYRIVE